MPSPEQISPKRHPAPAAFTPLMGWDRGWYFDGIGGIRVLWGAPLLPAPPTPSAHHVGRPWTPPQSPFPVVRRPRSSSLRQAAPGPSLGPPHAAPRRPSAWVQNHGISPHSMSCRIVISPGEKSRLRFCCAKNMFLRVSGTLRNPHGTTTKPPCREHQNPAPAASNSTSTPRVFDDSICKKRTGFHERDQVLEILLYQSAIDHQIDPNISDRLEQKIDLMTA